MKILFTHLYSYINFVLLTKGRVHKLKHMLDICISGRHAQETALQSFLRKVASRSIALFIDRPRRLQKLNIMNC